MADRSGIKLGLGITALMVVPIFLFGGVYWYRLSNVRQQTDAVVAPLLDPIAKGTELDRVRAKGGSELQSSDFAAGYGALRADYGDFVNRKAHRVVSFAGGGWDAGNIDSAVFSTEVEYTKRKGQLIVSMSRKGDDWLIDGFRIQSPGAQTVLLGQAVPGARP